MANYGLQHKDRLIELPEAIATRLKARADRAGRAPQDQCFYEMRVILGQCVPDHDDIAPAQREAEARDREAMKNYIFQMVRTRQWKDAAIVVLLSSL